MPTTSIDELIDRFRVAPGTKVRLKNYDPAWAGDESLPKKERKATAERLLSEDTTALAAAQELLYASDRDALLVIIQAMDAAGKDGTIKHVMSGINPQGVEVTSFKKPSDEELGHDFLWRCWRRLPERGKIGIFNRSYYEEVLAVRVHPELLAAQKVPNNLKPGKLWDDRFQSINDFERHLVRNGTVVVKFFLHVSKDEQRKRFLERLNDPAKHWKFNPTDLAARSEWDEYMDAYEKALSATSTKWAPWYVIPADRKWVARAAVSAVLVQTVNRLNLTYPEVPPGAHAELEKARAELAAE